MKKTIYFFITMIFVLFMIFSQVPMVMAATLDNIDVDVSKTKIAPGEQVTVTVNFGTELGAYTIDVAYDNNLFDYVSSQGGAENDNGTRVRLVYPNQTGSSPVARTNASVTFKAKENIVTSNPTDFAVTLTGLAETNPDNTFDDIVDAIKKDVLVEPNYVDYTLALNYEGSIEPNVAKAMTLTTSSAMGKNYDHVRLTAEVTTKPSDNATTKLLATNPDGNEIDILQTGWGEADGYALGGKNVKHELALTGEFSEIGNYGIQVKLTDRDDADAVIVEKTFNIAVAEKQVIEGNNNGTTKPENPPTKEPEEELPSTLPKTGGTQYALIFLSIGTLITVYYFVTKKDEE